MPDLPMAKVRRNSTLVNQPHAGHTRASPSAKGETLFVGGAVRTCLVITCLVTLLVGCVAPTRSYWVAGSRPVEWIDYGPWNELLRAHVVDGFVDYDALDRSPEFNDWVRTLRRSRFTEETSAEQRLAFWLNGYTAAAISGILRGGSLQGGQARRRYFERALFALGGEEITLWALEHERLSKRGDPRIHFAVACAAVSCPRPVSVAFDPARLDTQLEHLTHTFINDPTRNQFDAALGVARLSQIFEWNAGAFAPAGGVAAYVARYVDQPEAAAALREGRWKIEYLPHNWSLNGRPIPSE
jgi:hypothetical protein